MVLLLGGIPAIECTHDAVDIPVPWGAALWYTLFLSAAVLGGLCGQGRVVLLSPHIEACSHLMAWCPPSDTTLLFFSVEPSRVLHMV